MAVALTHRTTPARGAPAGALALFHGRGTDEHDLVPLLEALDPERRLTGLTPRGPLSLPPGGAHWYVVRRVGHPERETFLAALEQAANWLGAVGEETGVPIERTVLGGFSQGTVMSFALGLGRGRPAPAGILALSGFLPTAEGLELDLGRPGVPIAIRHGTLDPVIGVEWGREARSRLEEAGATVDYREGPVGHGIDPRWLPELSAWLARALQLD